MRRAKRIAETRGALLGECKRLPGPSISDRFVYRFDVLRMPSIGAEISLTSTNNAYGLLFSPPLDRKKPDKRINARSYSFDKISVISLKNYLSKKGDL